MERIRRLRAVIRLAALIGAIVTFGACDWDLIEEPEEYAEAEVMFYNAVGSYGQDGAIDLTVSHHDDGDDFFLLTEIDYAKRSGYYGLIAKRREFRVYEDGTDRELARGIVELAEDEYYSVVAYSRDLAVENQLLIVYDRPLEDGSNVPMMRVVYVPGDTDAPAAELAVDTNPGGAAVWEVIDGLGDLDRGEVSRYVAIDGGTNALQLREAGGMAVLAEVSATFETGESYVVLVSGFIDAARFRSGGNADNPALRIDVYRE